MPVRDRRHTRRASCAVAFLIAIGLTHAHAQDLSIPARTLAPLFAAQWPNRLWTTSAIVQQRPSRGVLLPLYVSFATLEALDVHSTLSAVNRGAVEANPLMSPAVNSPAALVAVKAGVAASTILLAEKLRRRSRVGAIVLMTALNSAYAAIVAHNYRVARH